MTSPLTFLLLAFVRYGLIWIVPCGLAILRPACQHCNIARCKGDH